MKGVIEQDNRNSISSPQCVLPKTVTFVVPALNEEESIADVAQEIAKSIQDSGIDGYEILFVNDCSTDNTGLIMDQLAGEDPHVRVIHNKLNLGLGGAYSEGIKSATCAYVIMIPGDNNHPAAGITPILRMAGQADIIIPYVINRRSRTAVRQFLSSVFVWVLNLLISQKIRYFNGIVMHRTDFINSIKIETGGFAYQAEAVIKLLQRGATFAEVGVIIAGDDGRGSSAFRFRNIATIVETIWRLYRNKLLSN